MMLHVGFHFSFILNFVENCFKLFSDIIDINFYIKQKSKMAVIAKQVPNRKVILNKYFFSENLDI